MSIVALDHATVYCSARDRLAVLSALQAFGRMHLDTPVHPQDLAGDSTGGRRRAMAFLRTAHAAGRQPPEDPTCAEPAAVEARVLKLRDELRALNEEREAISARLRERTPWGDFESDALLASRLRLRFYRVPREMVQRIPATVVWQQAGMDGDVACIVVVADQPPDGMPGKPVTVDGPGPSALRARRTDVDKRIHALQEERARLAQWIDRLAQDLARAEDEAERRVIAGRSSAVDGLFSVSGWVPRANREALRRVVVGCGGAASFRDPRETERPPTLLHGADWSTGGRDLVRFYLTPAYDVWDPSNIVAVSFAILFGMMLGDAGYALVLLAGLALLASRSRRASRWRGLRTVAWGAAGFAFLWGTLCGNWFGMPPDANGIASLLHVLPLQDASLAMQVAVLTGVAHLATANLASAWIRRGTADGLMAAGWALLLVGAAALWLGKGPMRDSARFESAGWITLLVGAAALVGTALDRGSALDRAARLLAVAFRALGALGDTLSYLRLFALALAGAQLADAFNDLAREVRTEVPTIGAVLATGVLIVGHAFNLALATVGAMVHGLRLNYVEFFNWAIWREGRPFRPFARRAQP